MGLTLSSPSGINWTTVAVAAQGIGDLVFTTNYSRYAIVGKELLWEFRITKTTNGTGTDDVTFTPPGGVTVLDSNNAGHVSGFDLGNDNVASVHTVEAINSTNKFKVLRTGLTQYIRGGTFVGNSGVEFIAVSIRCAIA